MFLYFSILEHAQKIGYKIEKQEFITLVKNGQTRILKPEDEYQSLERENTISKYKNYFSLISNNLSHDNTKIKPISQIKASLKLLPIASQLISTKIKKSTKKETVLKKIEKKIANFKKSEYGFFLSSNRDDAFEPYDLLIKKMNKEKTYSIFTIDPITSSFLTKRNLPHLDFFEETILLADMLKNTEEGSRMINEIKHVSNENGLSLLFFKKFNQNILHGIYRSVATTIIMDNLLEENNFKKCIFMNGPMLSKVITVLTKKYHIPSLSIETVLVDNNALSSIAYDADKICIYGNQGKKILRDFGLDEDRIVVTGNPKYDYFKFIDQNSSRKSFCSSLHISFEKKIIVIAMSRWHKNDEKWMSKFIHFCNKNNYEIIIKLHPRYNINSDIIKSEISFIKENCKGQNYIITYNMSINDLILGTNLVISDFSNVAIESILLDKPVINVNFLKEELTDLQNFHEFGAASYAEDYETLEKIVTNILEKKNLEGKRVEGREKIIELFNYRNDGNATDRIYEILQK